MLLTVEHFIFFVKVFFARDSRPWNIIRPEGGHIRVIGHFFKFCVAGLYISFDKSKRVLCFPRDVIYVESPV